MLRLWRALVPVRGVRVVHADAGVLLTRLCWRCAADLMAPLLPPAAARASEAAG